MFHGPLADKASCLPSSRCCLFVDSLKRRRPGGDERSADDGGRERGSIMSVGSLTSDILERPVSEGRQSVGQR